MATHPDIVETNIAWERAREGHPADFPALLEIPGGCYTRENFHAVEQEHVWRKAWVCAGREEGVQNPGDFRLFTCLGTPTCWCVGWPRGLRQTEMQAIYVAPEGGEGPRPAF